MIETITPVSCVSGEEGKGKAKTWRVQKEGEREETSRGGKDVLFVPSSNSTNNRAVSNRSERRDCRRIEAQRVASVVGGGKVRPGGTISVMLLSCWGLEVVCGGRGEV